MRHGIAFGTLPFCSTMPKQYGHSCWPPPHHRPDPPTITLGPGTRVARGAVLRARNDDTATAPQNSSGLYYLHNDHLGTPRAVSDEGQQVTWRWISDPFGNGLPEEDPDGDGQRFTLNLRFPGQYYDEESGLHYNYFRYYDPAIGRYVTSDPIGLGGGLNTYSYVLNNPLRYTDPRGLDNPGCDGVPDCFESNCMRNMCSTHDECYYNFRCDASSWYKPYTRCFWECNMPAIGDTVSSGVLAILGGECTIIPDRTPRGSNAPPPPPIPPHNNPPDWLY